MKLIVGIVAVFVLLEAADAFAAGFLGGAGGNPSGASGNSSLKCYSCTTEGSSICPDQPDTLTEEVTCGLTETFCERKHDKDGVVISRGCQSVCISITDMLPTAELQGIIMFFTSGGNSCCQEDFCNAGERQAYMSAAALVVVLLAAWKNVRQ